MKIRVGTSGFYYEHWRGLFYPPDLPKSRFFDHYVRTFDTVELNSTFYHLPRAKTVAHWLERAPEGFVFALKAYRGITHYARLKEAGEELYRFLHLVKPLDGKLGPILFQLPPSLHRERALLKEFLALLPRGYRFVFEFRHESWLEEGVFELLQEAGAALCLNDYAKRPTPRRVTADFLYVRFHGPDGRYGGSYDTATLREWAEWMRSESDGLQEGWVYFNNDSGGHAVNDALRFRALLAGE